MDDGDRSFLPEAPDSDVTLRFTQTFLFEATFVSFDKPYNGPLDYKEIKPTPRPGRQKEINPDNPGYYEPGQFMGHHGGFTSGTKLYCGAGVGSVDGEPTGWVWIEPGLNSKGEKYGGCRRDFVCRLKIPPQEEAFRHDGGVPEEVDYECVEYHYGD